MKTHSFARTFAVGLALAAVGMFASATQAATINWGDLTSAGSTVTFEDVTENNSEATTLFADEVVGPSVVSNMLLLDPQSFQSQSNGSANVIDSTLSTKIVSKDGSGILEIEVNEFGDFTLGGLSGGEALASVGAAFFWRVTEVDGAEIGLPLQFASMSFTGGGMWERPGDDGTAKPWTGSVLLDIDGYLASKGIFGAATAVTLRFDNTLQTAADDVSSAFIKKKALDITVTTGDPDIPEPAALGMLVLGAVTATVRRRG